MLVAILIELPGHYYHAARWCKNYMFVDRVSVTLWMAATAFSKTKNRAFQKRTPFPSPITLAPIIIPKTREEEVLTM